MTPRKGNATDAVASSPLLRQTPTEPVYPDLGRRSDSAVALASASDSDRNLGPELDPDSDPDPAEALVRAYQAGDHAALLALHEALADDLRWPLYDADRRLPPATGLERADLRQEAWLWLAEAAAGWDPAADGPFRPVAVRAVRRALQRAVRRGATRSHLPLEGTGRDDRQGPAARLSDASATSDADRWDEAALARAVAAHLTQPERAALLLHAVHERPINLVARDLGTTRRRAQHLLTFATLRARAAAGLPPPAGTPEARTLALICQGADAITGDAPPNAWIGDQLGVGRRRVRSLMLRLGHLGYLERRARAGTGAGWRLRHRSLWTGPGARSA